MNDNENNPVSKKSTDSKKKFNSNRTTKLIIGILLIIAAAFLPIIAFLIGTVNIVSGNKAFSGSACTWLGVFWLASGIVLIATHNHVNKKGGEIAVFVMMIIAWLIALINSSFYVLVALLGWLSFLIGFSFLFWRLFILGIKRKEKIIFSMVFGASFLLGIGVNIATYINGTQAFNQTNKKVNELSKTVDKSDKEAKRADNILNGKDKATKQRLAKCKWNSKTLTYTTDKAEIRETYADVQPDELDTKDSDLIVYIDIKNISNKAQKISDLFNTSGLGTSVKAKQRLSNRISDLDSAEGTSGKTAHEVKKRSDLMTMDDKVLPGKTVQGIMMWQLKNTTSPVTIHFITDAGLNTKTIGIQTIQLSK